MEKSSAKYGIVIGILTGLPFIGWVLWYKLDFNMLGCITIYIVWIIICCWLQHKTE